MSCVFYISGPRPSLALTAVYLKPNPLIPLNTPKKRKAGPQSLSFKHIENKMRSGLVMA